MTEQNRWWNWDVSTGVWEYEFECLGSRKDEARWYNLVIDRVAAC